MGVDHDPEHRILRIIATAILMLVAAVCASWLTFELINDEPFEWREGGQPIQMLSSDFYRLGESVDTPEAQKCNDTDRDLVLHGELYLRRVEPVGLTRKIAPYEYTLAPGCTLYKNEDGTPFFRNEIPEWAAENVRTRGPSTWQFFGEETPEGGKTVRWETTNFLLAE